MTLQLIQSRRNNNACGKNRADDSPRETAAVLGDNKPAIELITSKYIGTCIYIYKMKYV